MAVVDSTSSSPIAKPTNISRDPLLLHPAVRVPLAEIVRELMESKIPLRPFELHRSPARQAYLYAQGRTRPGNRVTNARPWESMHQYGLAVDFALYLDGKWTWDASNTFEHVWDALRDMGEWYGLTPIHGERAHLELLNVDITHLQRGGFPGGGDETWWANLESQVNAWKSQPPAPVLGSRSSAPVPNPDPDFNIHLLTS